MSRLLALFLVLAYVMGAGVAAGLLTALKIFVAMLIPLACVWFPEAMGEYTGQGLSRITRDSPPSFVWLLGWVVLLLPVIVVTILWLQGVRLDGSV